MLMWPAHSLACQNPIARDYRSRKGTLQHARTHGKVTDSGSVHLQDPYILRNHLGGIECKLCLTLHTNEGSYLAHTQGKKHQTNLARRAARETKDSVYQTQLQAQQNQKAQVQIKQFVKIGSPGYQVTKVKDPITGQLGLLFQIHYPKIEKDVRPRYRFMSSYEQHVEAPAREHQYLVVSGGRPLTRKRPLHSSFADRGLRIQIAAEPYQTISFKIQSKELDQGEGRSWEYWDPDSQTYRCVPGGHVCPIYFDDVLLIASLGGPLSSPLPTVSNSCLRKRWYNVAFVLSSVLPRRTHVLFVVVL